MNHEILYVVYIDYPVNYLFAKMVLVGVFFIFS